MNDIGTWLIGGIILLGFFFFVTRPFRLAKRAGMDNRAACGCLILFFVVAFILQTLGVFD